MKFIPEKRFYNIAHSFGRYYISSTVMCITLSNCGNFMTFLSPLVRNMAIASAAIIYFGQLVWEWWKVFRFLRDQEGVRSEVVRPEASCLLFNALLFMISAGILIYLLFLGRGTEPVCIMTLVSLPFSSFNWYVHSDKLGMLDFCF
jgi:hypothetical protein